MNEEAYVDWEDEPHPKLNEVTNLISARALRCIANWGPAIWKRFMRKHRPGNLRCEEFDLPDNMHLLSHPKGSVIGERRLDFLVEDLVIVELRSIEFLAPVHTATMISYLRATGGRLGLLVNFSVRLLKEGIKRIAL